MRAVSALALALALLGARSPLLGRAPSAAQTRDQPWFVDAAAQSGLAFTHFNGMSGEFYYPEIMAPGVALLDYDNDGDVDIVVGNDSGPARLLINTVGNRAHWLGVRLVSARPARDLVGARVAVFRGDGRTIWRRARADGSYASANDPRVLAGLGDSTTPPRVRVQWPDGRTEEWNGVAIDRYTTLTAGSGRAVEG